MKKEIVCQYQLFDLHQFITLINGDDVQTIGISHIDRLGSDIAKLCNKFDVNDVHLYGAPSYAEKIIQEIIQTNATEYNNRPINVEIN